MGTEDDLQRLAVSALSDALRKKFASPQEAIRALGLDEALLDDPNAIACDSKEGLTMPTNSARGKIAKDNAMMGKPGDKSVSEAQHNAMEAAAHGNSTLGIPESVGKEFAEADKKGGDGYDNMFMKKAMDWMKSKGMDAGMTEEFMEHMGKPEGQDGEEEEPEEVTEGFKDVVQHAEDRPRAKDMRRADDRRADDRRADDRRADDRRADDRRADDNEHAMDEASIEKRVTERLKAKFDAAREVKPWVGEVDPMAFDSGEAIYRHALKARGHKRWNTAHSEALRDLLDTFPKAGARPVERRADDPRFAMDSSRRADAEKIAPGLKNIRIGV